jgi:hypothetical protein
LDTQVDELIDLVARLSGHDRTTVALTSRVRDDLGIDGDDADELLQAISARWNVDWTGFEFQQYFVEEPSVGPGFVLPKLGWRKPWIRSSITIAHLAAVVHLGRWFWPPGSAV